MATAKWNDVRGQWRRAETEIPYIARTLVVASVTGMLLMKHGNVRDVIRSGFMAGLSNVLSSPNVTPLPHSLDRFSDRKMTSREHA